MLYCPCIQIASLALSGSKLNDIAIFQGYAFLSALQNGVSNTIDCSECGDSMYLKNSSTPVCQSLKLTDPYLLVSNFN